MNILCIAPYHVTGTLNLWQNELRRRGHRFRYVTLFRSPYGFKEDICLDLPLQPDSELFVKMRSMFYHATSGAEPDDAPLEEKPPVWRSPNPLASAFFAARDTLISPTVENAIRRYNLDGADIIWLDQGAEFYRDGRTVERWAKMGKPLMALYHGSDMRNRGIYQHIDRHVGLRLTSEVDLLYLDDRLEYLFLPVDLKQYDDAYLKNWADTPAQRAARSWSGNGSAMSDLVRIGHAARVRSFKGSDKIIDAVTELRLKGYPVEMVMIENVNHDEAIRLKATCDIFVDQIADAGGWGYGMSSVEALAMGIPTCTRMEPAMQSFVPDHPFVHVTADTLEAELACLVEDPELRREKGIEGRKWVERTHAIESVADRLLQYWRREGWM